MVGVVDARIAADVDALELREDRLEEAASTTEPRDGMPEGPQRDRERAHHVGQAADLTQEFATRGLELRTAAAKATQPPRVLSHLSNPLAQATGDHGEIGRGRIVRARKPAAEPSGVAILSLGTRLEDALKAADLLAGPWRAKLNAATMLGGSGMMVITSVPPRLG